MRRRKPLFVERRVLSAFEAAAYIGRSTTWLADHADRLYKTGFPRPIPVVGGYDKQAIDRWLDRMGSVPRTDDFDDAWTNAANG
jgi:hypothetical protein